MHLHDLPQWPRYSLGYTRVSSIMYLTKASTHLAIKGLSLAARTKRTAPHTWRPNSNAARTA